MTVAFQSCCVRIKAPPNHNARRDDANAQTASHMDTSTLLLRREVGEGTAIIANNSYYQTYPWVGARNVSGKLFCFLHLLKRNVRLTFRPAPQVFRAPCSYQLRLSQNGNR